MSSKRREQFLPGADGSILFAGRNVDVNSLAQELSVFPELQNAVAANDLQGTKTILESVVDPNEKKELINMADKDGFRLLHRACAVGSVELMKLLLETGADPNAKDNCGDAPMHWACFSGNLEAVEALLEGGGNPLLASSDGKTPLDAALEEKHTHILQLLFRRPWNLYDSRAILEAVLLRGPIHTKVQSRFVNSRRIWRVRHVVLSSMLRAFFIYRNKDMTDSADDCEHICFQDLLTVRWQMHTRKRYVGRRFNVYALVDDANKLKFNFSSSGFDDTKAGDFTIGGNVENGEVFVEEDEGASDGGDDETKLPEGKKGLSARILASFRRPQRAGPESGTDDPAAKAKGSTLGKSDSLLKPSALRVICISLLADTPKEARRWVEAFRFAGELGKTMPCVRIQTAWRGYQARMLLKKLKAIQLDGSAVVSRRGTKNLSGKFLPLDASQIVMPPAAPSHTALSLVRKPSIVNHILGGARKKTTAGMRSGSAERTGAGMLELPASFRARKTAALAVPVEKVFHNAEDISGYLKKRSETGVSGALRLWKNRFVVLSHTSAQLQYFDPKKTPHKIHRVPFSSMLSVKAMAGDKTNLILALRVMGGSTYRFEAETTAERDRWISALQKVLPRENVAALLIQRMVRGYLDRKRVKHLRFVALQRAMRKRDEALIRIEEARQRAAAEIEIRAHAEEEALLLKLQEEEKEYKRRLKAAKKKSLQQEAMLNDSPLPDEWQQFTDKKTGRIYYFCKTTGETTWKRPKVASREKEEIIGAVVEETKDSEIPEETASESAKRKSSTSRSLPTGWREVIDPSSGETYYFNSVTHESTWTRPTNSAKRKHWSKRFDEGSGHYYYYDERTGKSQWEVPNDFVDEEVEGAESRSVTSVEQATKVGQPKPEPTVEGEVRLSSAVPVVGASSPEKTQKKRTASQKEVEADETQVEERVSTSPDKRKSDRLSGTFAAAADKSSSRLDSSVASPTTQTLKSLQKALEKTTLKRTRVDNWQRFVDPKSGAPYFVNAATGEKTWTRPAVLGGPKSKKDAWISLRDGEGREYFNNSITGESVWVLPKGERLASAVDSPETDSEIVAAFTRHIDLLMSQFPKRRGRSFEADDDSSRDSEQESQLKWSLLDEEDDPYHYIALHERGGLFDAVRSGLLLCRLVNRVVPETIDPRAMNIDVDALAATASTVTEKEHVVRLATENHTLALGAIRALGGQLTETCIPEILMGKDYMNLDTSSFGEEEEERRKRIIEVIWEILQIDLLEPVSIVACRPLLNLMDSRKQPLETVHEFDGLHESEKILRWLHFHAPSLNVKRFGGANSAVFITVSLCCALWAGDSQNLPTQTISPLAHRIIHDPSHALSEEERSELFDQLAVACQSEGIRLYASRAQCLKSEDARLQLACCAAIFEHHHNLPLDVALTEDEQHELKALSLEFDLEESRDERILRTWINSLNIKLKPGSHAPGATLSPKGRSQASSSSTTLRIKNLFFDLRDGVVLLHVFQSVQPTLNVFESYNKVHLKPENKFHMLENASVIIDLAKSGLELSIVNLGPFDIVDGNRKLILGLTWQMMRYASISLLESLDTTGFLRWRQSPDVPISETDVLNWANDKIRFASIQKQTSARNSVKFVERPLVLTEVSLTDDAEVNSATDDTSPSRRLSKRSSLRSSLKRSSVEIVRDVTSFKEPSLRNGCFLLSLINAVRPGIVNWKHAIAASSIDMATEEGLDACERNAKYVVSLAFKLGVSVFLGWEDIVEVKARALFIFVASLIIYDARQNASSRSGSPASPSGR